MEKHLTLPLSKEDAQNLRAGDYVYLSGEMFTARDAAHKRMDEALNEKKTLPINIEGTTIYYMGPSPAREGRPIGSAGPTTAGRMDKYTPRLLDLGLRCMIGKGKRTLEVKEAIVRNKAVYFAAVGGAGLRWANAHCAGIAELEAVRPFGDENSRRLVVVRVDKRIHHGLADCNVRRQLIHPQQVLVKRKRRLEREIELARHALAKRKEIAWPGVVRYEAVDPAVCDLLRRAVFAVVDHVVRHKAQDVPKLPEHKKTR